MLSQPFQNSEMFHRTEIVSDLRTGHTQREDAAQGHAAASQKRHEEVRESVVEETKQVSMDPNQLPEKERQRRERQKSKRKGKSEENSGEAQNTVKHRNLGAGHIDLTA
jgi:hypothetical protein